MQRKDPNAYGSVPFLTQAYLDENPTWTLEQATEMAIKTRRLLASLARTWSNSQRRYARLTTRYLELNEAYTSSDSLSGEAVLDDEV